MNKDENRMLNFLKGITCIGVVFIHVPFAGVAGEIIKKIFSYAVPFYILISGYYAYGKDKSIIVRRNKKLLRIFLISFLLYFIFSLSINIRNGSWTTWLISGILNYKFVIKLLLFCTIDFAIPLWYLIAVIETYLLWQIVIIKKKENIILKTLPILFIIQLIQVVICESFNLPWFLKINFVTRALPWFLLGYKIKEIHQKKSKLIANKVIIIVVTLGIVIAILPTIIKSKTDFSCIGYILMTPMIFCYAIQNGKKGGLRTIELIGKNLSLYVYIFHLLLSEILSYIFYQKMSLNQNNILYRNIFPIVVCIVTLIVSLCFYYEKRILNNQEGLKQVK